MKDVTARSLDHFVLCVRNIEQAAEAYRRMGFTVTPVMEHVEIGTSNVVIQFNDTYIELIGDFNRCRVPALRNMMEPWLRHGDIYWQTSVTSAGLEVDRIALQAQGITVDPHINASRRVRLPSGGWIDTDSRSCYMWNPRDIFASLFMSDHRRPEAIWVPDYMIHPNGAACICGIRYLAQEPAADRAYREAILGGKAKQKADRVCFTTPRGEFLEIATEAGMGGLMAEIEPLQAGVAVRGCMFTVAVASLDRCRLALREGGIFWRGDADRIVVSFAYGAGMAFEFVELS